MLQLIRPRNGRDSLDKFIDSTFNSLMEPSFWTYRKPYAHTSRNWNIPVDVRDEDDNILVWAEIPGRQTTDLNVELNEEILTLEVTFEDSSKDEGDYVIRERNLGSMKRSITLPCLVDSTQSTSEYKNGVLKITLPKLEKVQTTRIPIS